MNNNTQFSVAAINDNFGVIEFNTILPIIIQYSSDKSIIERINVILEEPLGFIFNSGILFGFKTNIYNIPNLITSKFKDNNNNYCYFKKYTGMCLLFLCSNGNNNEGNIIVNEGQEYIYHFKYNFKIMNSVSKRFIILGSGSDINLIYPRLLDFSNSDSLIIRYITQSPINSKNIRINPYASDLGCKNLKGMKLCYVPIAHFRSNISSVYYTYHPNYNGEYIQYYNSLINVTLPKDDLEKYFIEIIDNEITQYLGKDNIFYLITNYNNTLSSLGFSENSQFSFNSKFTINPNDENNNFVDGTCHFWKPINENLTLICKLESNNSINTIYFNENKIKYGNNKEIFLFSNTLYSNFNKNFSDSEISFLYSEEQIIEMNDNTDSYELKFKKEVYYNNQLILYKDQYKNIQLNCNDKGTEISCDIKKDELIQILLYSGEKFQIYQIIDSLVSLRMSSVLDITINYSQHSKKQIYLEITKLMTHVFEINGFIAYETNITDIPKIITNDFYIRTKDSNLLNCIFKKNTENKDDKLLLLCFGGSSAQCSLSDLDREPIENTNIIYNFIVSYHNDEKSYLTGSSSKIYLVTPGELDFNKQDSYIIKYGTENPSQLEEIRLNVYSDSALKCNNIINGKECVVTQDHFTKNGEYYTYHYNDYNDSIISYEIPKIKVTLKPKVEKSSDSDSSNPDSESSLIGIIIGSVVGGLFIIGIIIFLVIRFKRKGNGEKKEKKTVLLQSNYELKEKEEINDK